MSVAVTARHSSRRNRAAAVITFESQQVLRILYVGWEQTCILMHVCLHFTPEHPKGQNR